MTPQEETAELIKDCKANIRSDIKDPERHKLAIEDAKAKVMEKLEETDKHDYNTLFRWTAIDKILNKLQ